MHVCLILFFKKIFEHVFDTFRSVQNILEFPDDLSTVSLLSGFSTNFVFLCRK